MKRKAATLRIAFAMGLSLLSACNMGKPIAVPEPESQLTPKLGLFSDDNGEWTIYRK
jgi:hypothetical protein